MMTPDTPIADPPDTAPQITLIDNTPGTRHDQLEAIFAIVGERQEPMRVRIPIQCYDPRTRAYNGLRDTSWSMHIDNPTHEVVEALIATFDAMVRAIQEVGTARTQELLSARP